MYNFEDLNVQINQNEQLTIEDKKFLVLYHKAMTRPDLLLEDEKSVLSSAISQKMNDTAFNIRVTKFEETLKQNSSNINNEFPYLDILQIYISPIPSINIVNSIVKKAQNKEMLNNSEIAILKKVKEKLASLPRCIEIYNKEKGLNLNLDRQTSSLIETLKPIDPGLYKVNQTINASKVLNNDYKKFLLLYNKVMNGMVEMSDTDKKRLSSELELKLKDKKFNEILVQFEREMRGPQEKLEKELSKVKEKYNKDPTESYKLEIERLEKEIEQIRCDFGYFDVINGYSHEIRNLDYIDSVIKKAQRPQEIIAQNGSLEENEKLSINELGVLQKANKLKRFIDIFEQKGIHDALTQTDHCKKMKEQHAKVQLLEKHIKNLFDTTVKRFQSGDVLVTEMDKSSAYRGRKPSIVSALKGALEGNYQELMDIPKKQFTKYGHAAQLTQVGTEIKQSHMWGEHKIDRFTYKDIVESDIFRVNISKLVQPAQSDKMKQIYGENWQEELQKLYGKKVAQVSIDPKLNKLKIISGINAASSLLPDWRYYLGMKNDDYKGLFVEDKLHKNEVICSDFVAREIVEAMNLVNQELMQKGLTAPIKTPIPENVDLSQVAPERLINLLQQSNCLEKIEAEELHSFINTKVNYHLKVEKQLSLTEKLYEKTLNLAKRCKSKEDFIREAKTAFVVYLTTNDNLSKETYRDKKNEIDKFLDDSLPQLYECTKNKTKHSSYSFIQFFCEMLEKVGIIASPRNQECQNIIDNAMILFKVQEFSKDEQEFAVSTQCKQSDINYKDSMFQLNAPAAAEEELDSNAKKPK